jgi:putative IMPACT (imprinted ancient) family translation regulator
VVSVVIRYYGGTPLGLPGLTRAYGEALLGALELAALKTLQPVLAVTVRFSIAKLDVIKRRYGSLLDTLTFDDDGVSVTARFLFAENDLTEELRSLCAGQLTLLASESIVMEV